MKKLMNFVIMTMMALLVCSCGNNGGQQETSKNETGKYYSYHPLLYGGKDLMGLVILYGDDNSANYVIFDDEENYYDGCIYEWAMALRMAYALYVKRVGQSQYNAYLKCVHCLPNCLDKYGIEDDGIREAVMKTYYDLQNATIYEPDRRYGLRKYPIDEAKYGIGRRYVELFRIKEGEYENIPGGTLGIRFTYI